MTNPFDDDKEVKTSDDPVADLLGQIKNDKGEPKYASIEEALKALRESQDFIPTLLNEKKTVEEELESTRSELNKRQTLEELAEALKSKRQPEEPTKTPEGTPKGVADLDINIDELLETKLSAREKAQQEQNNLTSVINAVSEKFGDKAKEHIQKTAEQLNTTPDKLKQLASESPALALRLLDTQGSQPNHKPTTSTVNAPRTGSNDNELPVFEKSAARGGMSNKELVDRWKQVQAYTHKKLGVKS